MLLDDGTDDFGQHYQNTYASHEAKEDLTFDTIPYQQESYQVGVHG